MRTFLQNMLFRATSAFCCLFLFLILYQFSVLNASAAVQYTDLVPDQTLTLNTSSTGTNLLPLDLNNDAAADFTFSYDVDVTGTNWHLFIIPQNSNSILLRDAVTNPNGLNYAAQLNAGSVSSINAVSPSLWGAASVNALLGDNNNPYDAGTGDQYIAVRINNGTTYQYGWIRVALSANVPYVLTVKDFALETAANTDIAIGTVVSNITATSQTLNFSAADNNLLYACGADKKMILTINPAVTNLTGTIVVKIKDANDGLYMNSTVTSNSGNVHIDPAQSDAKTVALIIQNLNTPAQITIPLYAGYCDALDLNTADTKVKMTLTDIFEVENNLLIAQNINADVYKGPSILFLNPEDNFPASLITVSADATGISTFQFVVTNNGVQDFNGWIFFQENPTSVSTIYDIRSISYSLYDLVAGTETELVPPVLNPVTNYYGSPNDNSFITSDRTQRQPVYVSIPLNHRLIIREKVLTNGCLIASKDPSNPLIYMGCGDAAKYSKMGGSENCLFKSYITTIQQAPAAQFEFVHDKSNYYAGEPNAAFPESPTADVCTNNYVETKKVVYKNTGTAIAHNVKLKMQHDAYSLIAVEKDASKIFVEINGVRYTPNLDNYEIQLRNGIQWKTYSTESDFLPSDVLIPESLLNNTVSYQLMYASSNSATVAYDINADLPWGDFKKAISNGTIADEFDPTFYASNLGCLASENDLANIKIINKLVIDELYNTVTNQYEKINIQPGDSIALIWEQRRCCASSSTGPNDAFHYQNPLIGIKFNGTCLSAQEYAAQAYTFTDQTGPYTRSILNIHSYDPTTSGDVDFCPQTQDGLVERISSTFDGLYLDYDVNNHSAPAPAYQNMDGQLVFRIFLEPGLDLDYALNGAIAAGYSTINGVADVTYPDITTVGNTGTGCTDCATCSPTVLPSQSATVLPSQNYYVRIHKNGQYITPVSVQRLESGIKGQPQNKQDLWFREKADTFYAANLYEVRFNIRDLKVFASPPTNISDPAQRDINQLSSSMADAAFDFDVRAYCSPNGVPHFKAVGFIDKCSGNDACGQAKGGYTGMLPLNEVIGQMVINCPGCRIPGANVNSARTYRENMGYVDTNDDGIADSDERVADTDPNAKIVANGDTLVSDILHITMSDGQSKDILDAGLHSIGVTKNDMEPQPNDPSNLANTYLDNIYVKVKASQGDDNTFQPFFAEMQVVGTMPPGCTSTTDACWVPMEIITQKINGYFMVRGNSNDVSQRSFNVGQNIRVRIKSRVGHTFSDPTPVEITYIAGFSPCDTATVDDFTIVNGTLDDNGVSGPHWPTDRSFMTYEELMANPKTFLICTTFSNLIKVVEHKRTISVDRTGDDNAVLCNKDIHIARQTTFHGLNYFKNEVREYPDTMLVEIPIPNGFDISKLTLKNENDADPGQTAALGRDWNFIQTYVLNKNKFTNYPSFIQIIPTSPLDPDFPTKICLTVPTASIALLEKSTSDYAPADYHQASNYTDKWISDFPLYGGDETTRWDLDITLAKISGCAPQDIVYNFDAFSPININMSSVHEEVNKMDQYYLAPLSKTANIRMSPFFDTPTHYYNEYFRLKKPVANMHTDVLLNGTVSNNIYQVPVNIALLPVDGTNIYSAQYPFLHIKGEAVRNGLQLIGVYLMQSSTDININNQTFGTNHFNVLESVNYNGDNAIDEYIVGLDQSEINTQLLTREPSIYNTNTYFNLVFRYDCSNCDIQKIKAVQCGDNSVDNICGTGDNNLTIAYGYNCSAYPTIADLAGHIACKYDSVRTTITNQKVLVEPANYIGSIKILPGAQGAVKPCIPFTYRLEIKSCGHGNIKSAGAALKLPAGYTLTEASVPQSQPGDKLTAGAIDADNTYHYNVDFDTPICCEQIKYIDFSITPPCIIGPNDVIQTAVSAVSYCDNTIPFGTVSASLDQDNSLIGLASIGVVPDNISVNTDNVILNADGTLSLMYHVEGTTKYPDTVKVYVTQSSITTKYVCPVAAGTPTGNYNFYSDCSSAHIVLNPQGCSSSYLVEAKVVYGFIPSCGTDDINCLSTLPEKSLVKKTVSSATNLSVDFSTGDNSAALLCGAGPVDLELTTLSGGTAPYTYAWSKDGSILDNKTSTSLSASVAGEYTLKVTDVIGCVGSITKAVLDHVDVNCPDPVCPGDNPVIQVSTAGIWGNYSAQWYADPNNTPDNLSDDVLVNHGFISTGDYYAAVIIPSCTLRTSPCHIVVKHAPSAYNLNILSADGTENYGTDLNICKGVDVQIVVMNQNVNDLSNTTIAWSYALGGSSHTDLSPLVTSVIGSYEVTATDKTTGCFTQSNVVGLYNPSVQVEPTCGPDGSSLVLNAYSNFSAQNLNYTWKMDGTVIASAQGQNTLTINQGGAGHMYTVQLPANLCGDAWGFYVPSPLPLTVSPSSNEVLNGGFENLTNYCTMSPSISPGPDPVTGVDLGLGCLELSDVNTNLSKPQPDLTYTIGKYFIDNSTGTGVVPEGANRYNSGWSGTSHSGSSFMIVDGPSTGTGFILWQQQIKVQHGYKYFLRAYLSNLDLANIYPVRELPDLMLYVTYLDANNTGFAPIVAEQTLALNPNGINQWIVSSGVSLANAYIGQSGNGEAVTAVLSIVMKNGGAIGRDVGIDDVEFWPAGLCQDVSQVVSSGITPCELTDISNVNVVDICPDATSADVYIDGYNPSLKNEWYQINNAGEAELMSTQPVMNNSVAIISVPSGGTDFDYMLRVSSPGVCVKEIAVHVKRHNVTLAISSVTGSCNNTFKADLQGTVLYGAISYEWLVDGVLVATTSTDEATLSSVSNGSQVSCRVSNVFCGPVTSPPLTISGLSKAAAAGGDRTICQGATTTLGSAAQNGYTYTWSSSNTNALSYLDHSNVSAPVLTASGTETTLTYTVTAVNTATGCSSSDDATVTIELLPAASLTVSPSSVCYGQSVSVNVNAPANSTCTLQLPDGSSLSVTPGILNSNVPWTTGSNTYILTVTTPSGCQNTASQTITVNPSPNAYIAGTSTQMVCSGSSVMLNAAAPEIDYTYQWLKDGTAITGATGASYGATLSGSYTLNVTGGNGCSMSSAPITVIKMPQPDVTVTLSGALTFCAGASVTLSVPSATGNLYYWQKDGTVISETTGSSYTATAAGSYVVTVGNNNGCIATSLASVVTVNPLPQDFVLTVTPATVCQGSLSQVNIGTPQNGAGVTYVSPSLPAGSTLSGDGGSQYGNGFGFIPGPTTPADFMLSGIATYTATGCSLTKSVAVHVNPLPVNTVTASGPLTFCQGGSVTFAASAGTGTYQWKNNGAAIAGATTAVYTAATAGSYTVTVTANNCPATSVASVVTVNPNPDPFTMTSTLSTACVGGTVSISINTPQSGSGVIYLLPLLPSGCTLLGAGSNGLGFTVGAGTASPIVMHATAVYTATNCSTTSNNVSITINPLPAAPAVTTPVNYCQHATASALTATGTALKWYTVSTGGTALSSAPVPSTAVNGTTSYYVSQTTNGCEGPRAQLTVNVSAVPTTASAGSFQIHCNNGTFALAGNTPSVGTGIWSVISGSANITSPNSPTTTVTSILATIGGVASTQLQWTISTGACFSSSTVWLENDAMPSTANAGSNVTQCNNGVFPVVAVPPAIGTGTWILQSSGGGTVTIDNANSASTTIRGINAGTTAIVMWRTQNNSCISTAGISLASSAPPTTSNAGTVQLKCNNGTFTTAANMPSVGTGVWSILNQPAGGTASIVSPTSWITTVNNVSNVSSGTSGVAGTTTLQWTITNGACSSSSTVQYLNYQSQQAANAGPDQTHCNNSVFTMAATPVYSPTIGRWQVVNGTASITDSYNPATTVTLSGSTATLLWFTSNGGYCSPSTDNMIITNNNCRTTTGIIETDEAAWSFSILPNPSSDQFSLNVGYKEDRELEVYIIASDGRLIQSEKCWTNQPFVFGTDYSSGMYMVQILYNQKIIHSSKVVKVK